MVELVKGKLSGYEKFSYLFADVGFLFMVTLTNTYLLVFLTSVIGLSAAVAGIIMTTGRIIDTISVPILGPIIERSNLRWGRYRSWVLIAPIFILIFNVLIFVDWSQLSQGPIIVLATAVYALFCIATNVGYIGYTSLNSAMANDEKEKVQLATLRGQGGSIGRIIAGYTILPLVFFFGGAGEVMTQRGFILVALFLGLVVLFTYLNLVIATKEKASAGVVIDKEGVAKKTRTLDMIRQVVSNRSLLMLFISDTLRILQSLILFSVFPFFFIYVVQDPSRIPWFFGNLAVLMLVGATMVPFLNKVLSKKNIYRIGAAILGLSYLLMYFNYTNSTLVITFACIGYVGYAWLSVVNTAMYADVCDYGLWKTGQNARGMVYSVFQLTIKVAAVFSTSISAFGLSLIGFQPDVAPTAEVIQGINNMAMLFPMCLLIVTIIAISFYKVDESKLPEMRKEIEDRAIKSGYKSSGV